MERLTKRTYTISEPHVEMVTVGPGVNVTNILDRLADYEDAEEQGLFVRLPCKVGDTVYALDEVMEVDVVHEINYGRTSNGDLRLLFLCEMGVSFYDNDVGKTVFLKREEAEAALANEKKR